MTVSMSNVTATFNTAGERAALLPGLSHGGGGLLSAVPCLRGFACAPGTWAPASADNGGGMFVTSSGSGSMVIGGVTLSDNVAVGKRLRLTDG